MTMKIIFVLFTCFIYEASTIQLPSSCPDLPFHDIPTDHLFHKKVKPLVIAHRGLPKEYQENTYDGIIASLDSHADGFELDIYKTKDDQLVVFHDDNTMRMTGVSKVVYNSTYQELLELNITDTIVKGGNTYTFGKKRKIPLLEDILKVTSKHDILHYLEMKPSEPLRPHELQLAKDTARLVAQIIEKMGLVKKAIIVSFDFRKVKVVKAINPNITVGTLFSQKFADKPKSRYLEMKELGNLEQCVKDGPEDTLEFFKFVLQSGLFFKQAGSSSFDCDIKLYNNPKYLNKTLPTLRQNYSRTVSTGFYTIYSMGKTEEQHLIDERKALQLIKQGGGQRFITDDVKRARSLLGKSSSAGTILKMNSFIICLNFFVFQFHF
ncbi:uncharacterized protein [Clytia hemisphaerica]|uniref:GP-PDE domain-containing protein n=1 Tax=Clytia hemisphaerica TaxID=252671 RepID=A0A7M5V6P9_9CNID|eukprot:TCONS_00001172-protein